MRPETEGRKAEGGIQGSASGLPPCSISVVLISWNTRDLLDQCLASLRGQVEETHSEVWVVDNDSADDSADMVAERHPWVRLIRNPGNVGFARACNLVIAQTATPYVFFFNPDATLEPGALAALRQVMEANPEYGALMPRLLDAEGRLTHFVGRAPRSAALKLRFARMVAWRMSGLPAVRAYWQRAVEEYLSHSATSGGPYPRTALEGAALFVRRTALDAVGPYDPDFFCGWEETDLTIRMRLAGWRLGVSPLATVRHWDSQSRVQWKWRYWEIPDSFYFARKRRGRLGLLAHYRAERARLKHYAAAGAPVEALRRSQAEAFRALWNSPKHPGYARFWPDAPEAVLSREP